MAKKMKSLLIDLPEEFYSEIINGAAEQLGHSPKTVVKTQQGQQASEDKRTPEQFIQDHFKKILVENYAKRVQVKASQEAAKNARNLTAEKLKDFLIQE